MPKKKQDFSEKEDAILIEKVNENAEQFLLGLATKSQTKRKKIVMDGSKKKWDNVKRVMKKRATDVRNNMNELEEERNFL
jgi:hypothetical protein